MTEFFEKRKFRRFEITGGEAKHKRTVLPALIRHFSKPHPVLNLSVGGLALLCGEDFRNGERVIIRLVAPDESPLNLHSRVRWQRPVALSSDVIVGFEFMPFDNNEDLNSPAKLKVLRRLYARYING